MRNWKRWIGFVSISVLAGTLAAQDNAPLINYATLFGEFDYDYFRGNPSVGLVRDGVAEGFSRAIPEGFVATLDESDKVSGIASQKLTFNRNSSASAEAALSMVMYFPSNDYPQPGETVRFCASACTRLGRNGRNRALQLIECFAHLDATEPQLYGSCL
jgi:hypothetical protein